MVRLSEELIDYNIERRRHEGFVGREALLARLDRLLVEDGADRWVVVTGGPGMGKSALLAAWLARREAAGAAVPHHFIRRGEYDWDDPAKLVGSLVAQIEHRFPGQREPEADERSHPAARLAAMLSRVSAGELAPCGERLVVMIDGLDEYDRPPGAPTGDPLAAFLLHALPRGVSFLCASRPKHPYVDRLAARDGGLVRIDLDERASAADNAATVRAFWERAAPPLGLDARFIDEAVARAGGNLQHAATLRNHLAGLPAERRRVEDIPRGLAALLEKSWQRIAVDRAARHGLGILCAAREALTLDELAAVAGWTGAEQRQSFVGGARELLVETQRPDGQNEYRLHHDSIRAHIAAALGAGALRAHHAELAQQLASWSPLPDAAARRYALRHALIHRAEAADWAGAWRLAADMGFLEAKCRELGAHDVEADVARVAERCRVSGDELLARRFADVARALVCEAHWLRDAPEAVAPLVWNRLRRSRWSEDEIAARLQLPAGARFLRVRYTVARESAALVRDLAGHAWETVACAVTSGSGRVVSASFDRTLKVWDLVRGRVRTTLGGHTSWVTACAVMADGARAISGADDGTLKVWDLEHGRVLATLRGHTGQVNACAATADGRRVISGSNDGTLKVWDLERELELATLRGHADWVRTCAVTADDRRVVSGSYDGTLKVWDLERAHALATFEGHTDWVRACAVTADGRRVVSASRDGTLKVWDLERGRELATMKGHTGWVLACAVTADGRHAVSGSADGTVRIWDVETGGMRAVLKGHADWVRSCAVTADGRHAVSGSADGTLKVWDLERALATPSGDADRVNACAVTADGRRMVSGLADGTLAIWDMERGRVLSSLEGHAGPVNACAVTMDGRRAISGSEDGTLKVWDPDRGAVLATLEGHAAGVRACAMAADGRRAVSGSADGTLKVWDLERRRVLATWGGHAGAVLACAMTADGRRVASGSADGTLKVWDPKRGRVLATLEGHAGAVNACAVTADGRRVASGSADGTLKVWDLERGRMLASLEGHAGAVSACAMTADGRHVVSASADRTLKVWDLETYDCLFTHRGEAAFTAVAATAAAIAAGDASGTVCLLDWPPPERRASPLRVGRCRERPRGSRPARESTRKRTILFLASNPGGTDPRAPGREARAIQAELERSGFRHRFKLVTRWAAEPLDLLRELRKLRPTVVHFSGQVGRGVAREHRAGPARHREVAGARARGLLFHGSDGRAQVVSAAALQRTIDAAGASVKLVVLNACYSEAHAKALLAHVDCVVGMNGSIHDDAARHFAIGFYGGLGELESVAAAYAQGCAAIDLEGLPDGACPRLKVRPGVDAGRLVLAAGAR
jgi:WD40 repeat protein